MARARGAWAEGLVTAATRYRGFLQIECGFSVNTIASYMRDVGDLFDDLAEASVKKVGDAQPRHLVEHVQALRAKKKTDKSRRKGEGAEENG